MNKKDFIQTKLVEDTNSSNFEKVLSDEVERVQKQATLVDIKFSIAIIQKAGLPPAERRLYAALILYRKA